MGQNEAVIAHPLNIAQIAVGPNEKIWQSLPSDPKLTEWEKILSRIITDDAFGADRMDYLLRDAHYAGVPNGVFDHLQLIEALRILPKPSKDRKASPFRWAWFEADCIPPKR